MSAAPAAPDRLRRRAQAVVFDCDGTLVDSEPLARAAWERSLAPYGYAIDDEEYGRLLGRPYVEVHGFFAEQIPGLAAPAAFWDGYSGTLFALIDDELEPFPDALETVWELHERGVVLAVASSSPRERLERTLARAGLATAFAATIAGDEVAQGKPAPDMFLAAAVQLGLAPEDCIAVEDSGPGVSSALAAGMRTIGIARFGDGADVTAADVVLDELSADAVLER